MTKTYKLVELAKAKNQIESDYGLSKLIDVSKGMVSHWKLGRSEASGVNLLKLIKAADLSIDDALKLMTEHPAQKELALNINSDSLYIM